MRIRRIRPPAGLGDKVFRLLMGTFPRRVSNDAATLLSVRRFRRQL